jgi:hypothetical protein
MPVSIRQDFRRSHDAGFFSSASPGMVEPHTVDRLAWPVGKGVYGSWTQDCVRYQREGGQTVE